MRKPKPLTNDEGEVRELLIEDLKRFRPAVEVLSPELSAKLAIEGSPSRKKRTAAKAKHKAGVTAGKARQTRGRNSD